MRMSIFNKNKKFPKYRVYMLSLERENFALALKKRFSRITPLYILIYTKDTIRGASEITDENIFEELTKEDREWLFGCNMNLIQETLSQNMNMLKEAHGKFLAELEQQIELVLDEEDTNGRKEDS